MKKPTPPELETITAKELEQQVNLQGVREMIIVEAEKGYQLHVPLRDFTGGRIRESAGKTEAVLQVSKPRMRVLATRREQNEARHYKKIETLHAYISETFPVVEMVQLKMLSPAQRKAMATNDGPRQPGRRSKAKAETADPAPAKKPAKATKATKRR